MDAKLAEYRARKRKEAAKELMYSMVSFNSSKELETTNDSDIPVHLEDGYLNEKSPILEATEGETSGSSSIADSENTSLKFNWFIFVNYILYFLLWATLYAIAVQMEFGTVFLIISILYGIWTNTRTGPKKQGEVSAYSVFNPNCEAIDGTLNAEQFEREIRYGAGSVHS